MLTGSKSWFCTFSTFFLSNAGKSGCWLNSARKALDGAFTLACMTNLLCCRQRFKICSMQWEPNETWCHKKISFPSNAIEVMKDLFCLVFWVTVLHDLWSPAELSLIGNWLPVDHWINHVHRSNEKGCVMKNPDGSRFACVTEGKNPSGSGLHRRDFTAKNRNPAVTPLDLSPIQSK